MVIDVGKGGNCRYVPLELLKPSPTPHPSRTSAHPFECTAIKLLIPRPVSLLLFGAATDRMWIPKQALRLHAVNTFVTPKQASREHVCHP